MQPNDARNRVLVALERNRIVGFAITGPAADPDSDPVADGEVSEFSVEPDEQRKGHGSRLVQACADTLVADRFTRAVTWLSSTDDALREFLAGAGWAPDGAHRELDLHGDGTVLVKQVRLHTASWTERNHRATGEPLRSGKHCLTRGFPRPPGEACLPGERGQPR